MKKSQIFKILTHLSLSLIFCFNWVFFAFALALKKADVPIGGSVSYVLPVPDISEFTNLTFKLSEDGTASVDVYLIKGEAIVPSQISSNGKIYSITRITVDDINGVTLLVVPATVKSVSMYQSGNLTTVIFEEGIQLGKINDNAFCFCSALSEIIIPSTVTSIGWMSFGVCTSLASINIPASVVEIGSNAFYNDTNLATVFIDSDTISSSLIEEDSCGYLIQYATTIYIKEGCGVGSYVTENFTQETSDQSGYVKYIKNQ